MAILPSESQSERSFRRRSASKASRSRDLRAQAAYDANMEFRRFAIALVALGASTALAAACATGSVDPYALYDAGGGTDSTAGDGGGCPQFDLQTDPKHCGTCTNACSSAQVCSNGACKSQCDAPLIKCAGDSGSCVDTNKDTKNCGACGTVCPLPDGGPEGGNGNPDAGIPIPDSGPPDTGTGWSIGTADCTNSKCSVVCPNGTDLCNDKLCWDTKNSHEHCGNCSTACAPDTEWCTQGKCCPTGSQVCNNTCVDILANNQNCGGCGIVCGGNTPVCSGGQCVASVIYSQSIPAGTLSQGSLQCTAWNTFLSQLTGTYSSITLKGSSFPAGYTCTGSVADQLCKSLHTGFTNKSAPTYVNGVSCNGHLWYTSNCSVNTPQIGLSVDVYACSCNNPGYVARPCIGNDNWGGVGTNSCPPPTQTITVECK